jgi:hypothetical protein
LWIGRDFYQWFESLLRVDSDYDRLLAGIEPDEASDWVDSDAPNHELHERFFEMSSFPCQEELPNSIVWNHRRTCAAPTDHAVVKIDDANDLRET